MGFALFRNLQNPHEPMSREWYTKHDRKVRAKLRATI
jgi:hypothetical protein